MFTWQSNLFVPTVALPTRKGESSQTSTPTHCQSNGNVGRKTSGKSSSESLSGGQLTKISCVRLKKKHPKFSAEGEVQTRVFPPGPFPINFLIWFTISRRKSKNYFLETVRWLGHLQAADLAKKIRIQVQVCNKWKPRQTKRLQHCRNICQHLLGLIKRLKVKRNGAH